MYSSFILMIILSVQPPGGGEPKAPRVEPPATPPAPRVVPPASGADANADNGGAANADAARSTTPPAAPPKISPDEVLADFITHVASSETYSDAARSFVAERQDKAAANPAQFINASLAVLSPEFKAALDKLFDDESEFAAATFESLSRSDDPFLAVAAADLGASAMIDLSQFERCAALIADLLKRHDPIERYTAAPANLRFMIGYCQVHQLEYDAAYKSLESFLLNHPTAPERLRIAASQMLTELARRAPGRLGDVYDLMNFAGRRISQGYTGDPVRQRQREAVDLLAALIEEAEEQEQQGDGDGDGGGGGGGSPGGNQGGGSGASRSALPSGESRVGELRRTRARPGDAWGKMPPKERERILQDLQKQFPSRYRDLLEQYYEQLARDSTRP